jgi:hypothetical protein
MLYLPNSVSTTALLPQCGHCTKISVENDQSPLIDLSVRKLVSILSNFEVVVCHFTVATNGHALAMAGQFITFCRNVCPVNEQKVEIFILLLISDFFSPELLPNNEQKADECTSRPAIANALVSCCSQRLAILLVIKLSCLFD